MIREVRRMGFELPLGSKHYRVLDPETGQQVGCCLAASVRMVTAPVVIDAIDRGLRLEEHRFALGA